MKSNSESKNQDQIPNQIKPLNVLFNDFSTSLQDNEVTAIGRIITEFIDANVIQSALEIFFMHTILGVDKLALHKKLKAPYSDTNKNEAIKLFKGSQFDSSGNFNADKFGVDGNIALYRHMSNALKRDTRAVNEVNKVGNFQENMPVEIQRRIDKFKCDIAKKNGDISENDFEVKVGCQCPVTINPELLDCIDVDGKGNNLLLYAALKGNEKYVQAFLDRGVDVNAKDKSGKTAADLVFLNSKLPHQSDLLQMLIDNGSDPVSEELIDDNLNKQSGCFACCFGGTKKASAELSKIAEGKTSLVRLLEAPQDNNGNIRYGEINKAVILCKNYIRKSKVNHGIVINLLNKLANENEWVRGITDKISEFRSDIQIIPGNSVAGAEASLADQGESKEGPEGQIMV